MALQIVFCFLFYTNKFECTVYYILVYASECSLLQLSDIASQKVVLNFIIKKEMLLTIFYSEMPGPAFSHGHLVHPLVCIYHYCWYSVFRPSTFHKRCFYSIYFYITFIYGSVRATVIVRQQSTITFYMHFHLNTITIQ